MQTIESTTTKSTAAPSEECHSDSDGNDGDRCQEARAYPHGCLKAQLPKHARIPHATIDFEFVGKIRPARQRCLELPLVAITLLR